MVKMWITNVPSLREVLTQEVISGSWIALPTGVSPEMLMVLSNHNAQNESEGEDNG